MVELRMTAENHIVDGHHRRDAAAADANGQLVAQAYARRLDETVSRLGLDGRVMFIENAPMADIPALYAGAVEYGFLYH